MTASGSEQGTTNAEVVEIRRIDPPAQILCPSCDLKPPGLRMERADLDHLAGINLCLGDREDHALAEWLRFTVFLPLSAE